MRQIEHTRNLGGEEGKCYVCSVTTKKQEQSSGVQIAVWDCVPAHVSCYITPNCISKDLTGTKQEKWNTQT